VSRRGFFHGLVGAIVSLVGLRCTPAGAAVPKPAKKPALAGCPALSRPLVTTYVYDALGSLTMMSEQPVTMYAYDVPSQDKASSPGTEAAPTWPQG
jgi:hypothetical protein